MPKSKIERKRKILDERKRSEEELTSKRKRIKGEEELKQYLDSEENINRPDEIIGLIIFMVIPNIIIPFVSFIYSIITLIILLINNDLLLFWYLYAVLMFLIIAILTGLTSYWLYKLYKPSYYLALGICLFNLATNISLFFTLNAFIIIIAVIILILNCINVYFLLAYKEIREALGIPSY